MEFKTRLRTPNVELNDLKPPADTVSSLELHILMKLIWNLATFCYLTSSLAVLVTTDFRFTKILLPVRSEMNSKLD